MALRNKEVVGVSSMVIMVLQVPLLLVIAGMDHSFMLQHHHDLIACVIAIASWIGLMVFFYLVPE